MSKKTFGKYALVGVLVLLGVFVLLFGMAFLKEYRPKLREGVRPAEASGILPDTLLVLSWNIGYGGLGAGMDFFYDGGRRVRDSREQTRANLEHILALLKTVDADIMLLQEVDLDSRRTYGIDQAALLRKTFPEHTLTFAYNYKAPWVPVPWYNPMGRVASGVAILSRVQPVEAVRLSYPSGFPFPERMFNLKRCLLAAKFLTARGDTLLVGNTHNTAFGPQSMQREEMDFLKGEIARAPGPVLLGGDWNQYPPGYTPSEEVLSNPHYAPGPIGEAFSGLPGVWIYDTLVPSLRYLDKPYGPESATTVTDFFWASDALRVLSVETLDEGFSASDHNPVLLRLSVE